MKRDTRKSSDKAQGFLLDCTGEIQWDQLPDRGWFAVFDKMPHPLAESHRLFLANGAEGLRRGIEQGLRAGRIQSGGVYVETAASESDLTDPEYGEMVYEILHGIDVIKKRGDTRTLNSIRAAVERKDAKPGPKPKREFMRWKIDTLRAIASGKPLKQAVTHPMRTPGSASAELGRFCADFYDCCWWFGAHKPEDWRGYVADVLCARFGFQFPQDLDSAIEAYRRGKETFDRRMTRQERN